MLLEAKIITRNKVIYETIVSPPSDATLKKCLLAYHEMLNDLAVKYCKEQETIIDRIEIMEF